MTMVFVNANWIMIGVDVAAVVGLAALVVAVAATRATRAGHYTAQAAALTPLVAGACVGAGLLGVVTATPLLGAATVLCGLAVATATMPVRRASARGPLDSEPGITLVSSNVLITNHRFRDLARSLLDEDADVVVLQEITSEHAAILDDVLCGYGDRQVVAEPRDDYAGWAIVSKHPIVSVDRLEFPGWPIAVVAIDHPSGRFRLANIHTAAPTTTEDATAWGDQFNALERLADPAAPTVLAGDFNATDQHAAFRRLLECGFTDAFEEVGTGWGATWPSGGWRVPVLRLDHVLTGGPMLATSVTSRAAPGSDHLYLCATLRFTADLPSASDRIQSNAIT